MTYKIRVDHLIYSGYTLGQAFREVYRCGNSAILRGDGTVIAERRGYNGRFEILGRKSCTTAT